MIDLSSWSKIESGSVSVLYADPPWSYRNTAIKKNVNTVYPTLELTDLFEMKNEIKRISNINGCSLLMWTTGVQMWQAMRLLDEWEFRYKTVAFTWVKLSKSGFPISNPGNYTRSASEFVLLGTTKAIPKRKIRNARQIVETIESDTLLSQRLRHSEKPEEVRTRIETLFDGPYFELFARKSSPGWLSWGNEIDDSLVDYR